MSFFARATHARAAEGRMWHSPGTPGLSLHSAADGVAGAPPEVGALVIPPSPTGLNNRRAVAPHAGHGS